MNADGVLHLVFLGMLGVLGFVRADFLRRLRIQALRRRDSESPIVKELRDIAALMAGLIIIAHIVVPSLLQWSDLPMWDGLRWFAAVVAVLAIPWLWTAERAASAPVRTRRVAEALAMRIASPGPYQVVRHPVYLGTLIEVVALIILSGNWVVALMGAAWFAQLTLHRIPREDRERRALLGATYDEYAARVPRLVPRRLGRAR